MATEIPIQMVSLIAAADLSAKQFYAIVINGDGNAAVGGAGAECIGVLQNDPAIGKAASVMALGESMAIYGDTVTAGYGLASDGNGKLIHAVAGDAIIAIAMEGGSVNEIRRVILLPKSAGTFPAGTQGDVLYYDGAAWTSLGVGTDKQFLKTQGAAADPAWANGVGQTILSIPIKLSTLPAPGDVLTTYTPGFAGTIKKVSVAVVVVTTDNDADAVLNLEIGVTNLTGGAVTIADDNVDTLGAVVDGTEVTAANVFAADDTISIESVVTNAFSDGELVMLIVIEPVVTA